MSRTALLAGATGLVGGHVLEFLLAADTWSHVVTVGRRSVAQSHEKLEQRILDLGAIEALSDLPHAEDVFCCLGTTIRQAGSQQAFRRVDHDFVVGLARAGIRGGARQFLLVSAVDADTESRIFYSRVKGEAEMAVRKLPYRATQIFRPSLLLGKRAAFRFGERAAMLVAPVLPVFLLGGLRRYRPISASSVAQAMVNVARAAPHGTNVYEYDAIVAHGA